MPPEFQRDQSDPFLLFKYRNDLVDEQFDKYIIPAVLSVILQTLTQIIIVLWLIISRTILDALFSRDVPTYGTVCQRTSNVAPVLAILNVT